jgi:hypothetical protein
MNWQATVCSPVGAFEPSWLVGYRLFVGPRVATLAGDLRRARRGTHVRLHQAGDIELAVSLEQLARLLDEGGAYQETT